MFANLKHSLFSYRSLSVGFGFVLFALIFGIYLRYRPSPAGSSLEVTANAPAGSGVQEASIVNSWYEYANLPTQVNSDELQPSLSNAAPVHRLDVGWLICA